MVITYTSHTHINFNKYITDTAMETEEVLSKRKKKTKPKKVRQKNPGISFLIVII